MKILFCSLMLSAAAFGQLQFYSYTKGIEVAITGSYSIGAAGVGSTLDVPIRVRNAGATSVSIPRITLSGQGFKITKTPTLPVTLAPGDPMDITVQYAPTAAGIYSANLGINSASIVLVGNAALVPTISITQNGQRQDIPAGSIIDFGRVQRGTSKIIAVSIENRSAGTMTVKSMQFSGSTLFSTANAPAFPLTLNPTEVSVFNLQFSPSASVPYSAAITLDSQTVPLTGTGFDPPFSKLSIIVDASLVSSIQPSLSITLDQPAPTAATGTLTLGFQPSVGGGDDTAIRFMAAGGRVLSFSFNAGDTTATIGTSRTASFQTGTTAGTLTFAAVFQNATTQAVSKVQPQAVQIESTISNRPNNVELRIQLTGYDNSKSASQLAFTFYDSAGATIQPGRIAFNATTDFTQFFATSSTGGLFSLLADFPVKGAANSVSSVDVELTNSAGVTTLSKLLFSPCVPVITTPCPNATGCPCT